MKSFQRTTPAPFLHGSDPEKPSQRRPAHDGVGMKARGGTQESRAAVSPGAREKDDRRADHSRARRGPGCRLWIPIRDTASPPLPQPTDRAERPVNISTNLSVAITDYAEDQIGKQAGHTK